MSNSPPAQHSLFSFPSSAIDPALMDLDDAQALAGFGSDTKTKKHSFFRDGSSSPEPADEPTLRRSTRPQGYEDTSLDFDYKNVDDTLGDDGEQLINRSRAASSIIDDISDGKPYIPSRSPSSDGGQQRKKKKTAIASMSPEPPSSRMKRAGAKAAATSRANLKQRASTAAPTAPMTQNKNKTVASPFSMRVPDFKISIASADPHTTEPFPAPDDVPEPPVIVQSIQKRKRGAIAAPSQRGRSPSNEIRNSPPISDDIAPENERTEFAAAYQKLVKGHQAQTVILDTMHREHEKAMKRVHNTAARRKQRVEALERENTNVRSKINGAETSTSNNLEYEAKLAAQDRTIQMLTKDLEDREAKYNTSQAALRSTNDDALTFERKYNVAQASANSLSSQLDETKAQLEDAGDGIKNGTKQLKSLQKILTKVDRVIIMRVKELARLSGQWDRQGGAGEQLKSRVAEEMTNLINAWRRFEGEYDEGIVAEGVET